MMAPVLLALGAYVALILLIGVAATRSASRSPEEYFLAGRGLGRLVLFMALFGTNATPWVLVGIPGQAFRDGIGIFGLNAPIVALGIPLSFWAIGAPARAMSARLGALTPAELHARRFGSPLLGMVLFGFFFLYTVPYMVSAVRGAATTLAVVSAGALPPAWGGLGVVAVALIYTSLGGMRGTAWTNVLQGSLFLGFMLLAFFLVASSLGGLGAATAHVLEQRPDLLRLNDSELFQPRHWASYGLVISLTVIAFPHMLVRLMAARSDAAMKTSCRLYPVALAALWVPAVMLGVWGAAEFPDLTEPDQVFSRMITTHLPPGITVLGSVAVLAAVMSTLDAQILTLGSMLSRDVLAPLLRGRAHDTHDVASGRLFALLVASLVYVLSLTWGESVFRMALFAFQGYVTLVPTLFFTVRWRRFTAGGALASLLAGNAVYAAGELGWLPLFGFPAVLWAFLVATLTAVAVTRLDRPPDEARTRVAFGESGVS